MNIGFLHISDLHLRNKHGINEFQMRKLADAVQACGVLDELIIVISGDIAYSGEASQYTAAYKCLGNMADAIKEGCELQSQPHLLCVPGNHDVDHRKNGWTSSTLKKVHKAGSYEKHLPGELAKQKAFGNFAKRNHCFTDDQIFFQTKIDVRGFSIEANLVNTALFSIKDIDKGLHYIPQYCMNELGKPTGADLVITAMHHPPDWYCDGQKNLLDAAVYGKSSLVFLGHEHYSATKAVYLDKNRATLVQAGGCLCKNDDWTKSEFHVGKLDTDTMLYSLRRFRWNPKESQYETGDKSEHILAPKPSKEKCLVISPKYKSALLADTKHGVCPDFRDYFVFPRIQAQDTDGTPGAEYVDEASFVEEILSRGRVEISGGQDSGKSTLLKSLFLRLSEDYAVIYCDIDSIHGKKPDRFIRNCLEEIYGTDPSNYDRFLQMPREKRILMVDDIDRIEKSDAGRLISELDAIFGHFIATSRQVLDLNLLNRMKSLLGAADSIYHYLITPFYSDKRLELIRKVVTSLSEDKRSVETITRRLSDAMKAQRRFIGLEPSFIIQYVEYFCKNIGEVASSDTGVFSKVFEASLTNAIVRHATKKISVDKAFVLLSKIAHYIHFHKAYPITRSQIQEVIEIYNDDYGDTVDAGDTISIMVNAKILHSEDESSYRFANRNHLAFFVAREVNNQYRATGDGKDLQRILQSACFGINSDILLFISYITDDIRILRLIVQTANEYTGNWKEFDFEGNMPQFLVLGKDHYLHLPPPGSRQEEEQVEIEAEKLDSTELNAVDIYDYSDDAAEEFVNQVIRACSLLTVVSKCLPSFEHTMRKADKIAFVDAIYRLPNRIFHLWAAQVDKAVDDIVAYLRTQSQDFYSRHREVTNDDILRALQWGAMSLLLDLYSAAVFHAAKQNAAQYLDQFSWKTADTHSIEHLMMLERLDAGGFAEAAIAMADNTKNPLYTAMVKRVVQHAIIFMDETDFRRRQRLQDKFFPGKTEQRELIMRRSSNTKVNE